MQVSLAPANRLLQSESFQTTKGALRSTSLCFNSGFATVLFIEANLNPLKPHFSHLLFLTFAVNQVRFHQCQACPSRKVVRPAAGARCGAVSSPVRQRLLEHTERPADARQPHCDRCVKAGFSCEGYPSRLQWIDEGPRLAQDDRHSNGIIQLKSRSLLSSLSRQSPRALSLAPFRQSILSSFLHEGLHDGLKGYTYTSWMTDTLREDSRSPARVALDSLAAVFFATQHSHDHAAMQYASTLYGAALRNLSEKLNDPITRYSYSNVSAVFALSLYELYASTQEFGWVQHAGGIGSLMQSLGPIYFAEYPAHGLFLLARSLMIVRSYRLREPCFLAENCWRSVPWQLHPETQDGQHSMLSLIACIPSFHARCMEIDESASKGLYEERLAQQIEELKEDAIDLGKDVIKWRMEWEARHPACAWEIKCPKGSVALDRDGIPLFGNMLWFSTRDRCIEILLYNSAMAAILHFQRRYPPGVIMRALLEEWTPALQPLITNQLLFPCDAMHSLQCATEICKTVDYALSTRCDNARYLDLFMPLGIR